VSVPPGSGPDDVAVADDGSVYWTGFTSGEVGRVDPATGESETVAMLEPGANPITFDGDDLLVARTLTGQGLYRVDTSTGDVTELLADPGNLNAFQVGSDGLLYAPLAGDDGAGSVVRIDPESGVVEPVVTQGLGFPVAVRWHDDTLYVLQTLPSAELFRSASGELTSVAVFDGPVDNLALDEDGTAYVTGFDTPTLSVVDSDGTVTVVPIGEG
jgi:sugar lactone lactonase YvrE